MQTSTGEIGKVAKLWKEWIKKEVYEILTASVREKGFSKKKTGSIELQIHQRVQSTVIVQREQCDDGYISQDIKAVCLINEESWFPFLKAITAQMSHFQVQVGMWFRPLLIVQLYEFLLVLASFMGITSSSEFLLYLSNTLICRLFYE